MTDQAPALPPSLWAATAPPAPDTPSLAGDVRADVTIIGGGFTGLSTALHLAEQGIDAVVLEAGEPGWGASGRNGGQVLPIMKETPEEVIQVLGAEDGEKLIETSARSADVVFDLIERHGIDCAAERCGWIRGAHNEKAEARCRQVAEAYQARGFGVEYLDRDRVGRELGTQGYVAGVLDTRAGKVQPLAYARGLARAALAAGGRIHGGSRAVDLERTADGWRTTTVGGSVTSDWVVLATNGYGAGLVPGLDQTVIPVVSAQAATAPLTDNVRASIVPGGQVVSDSRRLIRYFRMDADGRLIMGGRGRQDDSSDPAAYQHIIAEAKETFPQLGEVEWTHYWGGYVALTLDHFPHLHEPQPGLLAGIGFNGRGVAMATTMGTLIAQRIGGTPAQHLGFPVTTMKPIPFHGLRAPARAAVLAWYKIADRFGW